MTTGPTAKTYPTEEQYEGWREEAGDRGMSISEWIQAMVEAGRKKFGGNVNPDYSEAELREQNRDLRDELSRTRERVQKLERRLHQSEAAAIRHHIEENPGASYDDIVRYIIDTSARRTTNHIETMQGDEIEKRDGGYYLR